MSTNPAAMLAREPTDWGVLCLAVTEHAPLPIATVEGLTHIVRYVNPAFCRLMDQSQERLLGRPLSELLPQKDHCVALLDRVIRTKKPETHIEQDPSKPHPVFWSYIMWPVVADELLVGVMIQVTETAEFHDKAVAMNEALMLGALRQHEITEATDKLNRALHESRERYQALFGALPVAVFVCDRDTVIQYFNPRAAELWEREPAIGVERHFGSMKLLHNDGAALPHPESTLMDVMRTGIAARNMEMIIERPDGSRLPVVVNYAPLRDAQGEIVGAVTAFDDISERKQAEMSLRQSEERYRTLFNSIDEGFCVIEMIQNEQGMPVDYRFLEVNPSFEKQSGIRDAAGKRMRELSPRHEEYWFEIYGKVARSGEPIRFVNEMKAQGGRWLDVYAFRIGGPGSQKVAVLFNDITARRRDEQALRVSQEQVRQHAGHLEKVVTERTTALRASIQSLEELNYTMAHDLRAPIRAMQGLTEALLEDVPLNETGVIYAGRIIEASRRMDRLVNALLEYGDLSHREFPVRTIDLKSEIENVLATNAKEFRSLQVRIEVREPLPRVFGNESLLEQILTNLIGNAVKFVPPGAAAHILLRGETRGSMARLWVEDNGIGIASEYQEKIFGVFQRLHTNEEFAGTGVGLAIVKRAVERMGGRVGLESEVGQGSKFWFELPQA